MTKLARQFLLESEIYQIMVGFDIFWCYIEVHMNPLFLKELFQESINNKNWSSGENQEVKLSS